MREGRQKKWQRNSGRSTRKPDIKVHFQFACHGGGVFVLYLSEIITYGELASI